MNEQHATYLERYANRLLNGVLPKDYGGAPINRHEDDEQTRSAVALHLRACASTIRAGCGEAEVDWPV